MKLNTQDYIGNNTLRRILYDMFDGTFELNHGKDPEKIKLRIKRHTTPNILNYLIFDTDLKSKLIHKMVISINNLCFECIFFIREDRNSLVGKGRLTELDNNETGFSINVLPMNESLENVHSLKK
jgi:hypothetical protein